MTPAIWIALSMGFIAGFEDMRRRSVPNWLTAGGALAGLACAAQGGWRSLGMAAGGMALGFVILLPFYLCGAMGAGDVKLLAAYGVLLGPSGIAVAAVFAAVIGGVSAAGALLYKPGSASIPYAPALVLGAWISMLGGT